MPQDWFAQNAPKGQDWFAQNAPASNVAADKVRQLVVDASTPKPAIWDKADTAARAVSRMTGQGEVPIDLAEGAAKELGSTAYSILSRMQRVSNPTPPLTATAPKGTAPLPSGPVFKMPEQKPDFLKPEGVAQNIGAAGATAAEFYAPGAALEGSIPAIAKLGTLGKAAIQGATSGVVGKARGESNTEAVGNAATTAGMTSFLGWLGSAAGATGERVERGLLKPLKADLADVKGPPEKATETMVKNLFKYDLGGTLQQSYQKATALTKSLGAQLRAALGSNPTANVDLTTVLADTANELNKARPANFGVNAEVGKAVNKMLDEIQTVNPTGVVNLADAQDIKQALGMIGSWQNGARDADSTATETVANAMYTKLKTAIEQASGQSATVQDINRQFGEVIPIKNAILRRIPVFTRRDPIGLKEALGLAQGSVPGAALAVADRVLKSGTMANALVQAGKAPISSAAPIVTGAATSAADYLRNRMRPQ